ncbi:MAG: DUF4351 domain-containing protein [Magnetococcales bacterium]|nr:DUF4351 domain-containing protein [Magnetococcales bacterium]
MIENGLGALPQGIPMLVGFAHFEAMETIGLEQERKTYWHRLVGETLKVLLEPVGIEVRMEVPVAPAPPVADLILIQRKEVGSGGWTQEQRVRLADGLHDLEADQILVELKVTESLNEKTLTWLSVYDTLYLETAKLKRHQLKSVIISAITSRKDFLEKHSFKPVGPVGVYESIPSWGGVIRLIFLNELADETHNAPLKCFASRQNEQEKAFATIQHAGLSKLSEAFGRVINGLWRLKMKSALNHPGMEEITPEYVIRLGEEWFESMVDATPEEKLFSLPKLEHRLKASHRDSEAKILTRQLQRRFGTIPEWANEKIAKAEQSSLEDWSLRFVDAQSLDDVFSD